MEPLIGLGLLIVVAIPIAVVYLLISNASLRSRVGALEAQLSKRIPEPVTETDAQEKKTTAPRQASEDVTAKASLSANPWQSAQREGIAAEPQDPTTPPKAVVLTSKNVEKLISWGMQNWFYVVSALSLALAGVFLVLYGVEQGLLPPPVRVAAAFALGFAMVGGGEYIRRRFGDEEGSATAYLPSTFSGAGIVTLFGAVLSARLLYGFIGPEVALIGMALVGIVAIVLGWFYGPFLAAVGVIGAMVAPFIIGGSSDNPSGLLAYFLVVAVVGLAIDTMRRWAWLSLVAVTLGFLAGFMLNLGTGAIVQPYFVLYCAALTLAAIAIPVRKVQPDHGGTSISLAIFARAKGEPWPEFPTRIAGGSVMAASALILVTVFETSRADLFWTGVVVLAGLVLGLLVWARNAPALSDLAALPAVALVAIAAAGERIWNVQARAAMEPEADMPLMATWLVAIGVALSLVAAWRSLRGGQAQNFIAMGAALFAPALAIMLEVFWDPAQTLGAYTWALHAMAVALLMVVMAERFARADGPQDRLRMSFAVLSALACIAFGVVVLFTLSALTTAIAITIVAAAWLDRQFNLPLMGLYILAGITTLGYRLIVDPGLDWAIDAPLFEMLFSHGGAVVALAGAWALVRSLDRPRSQILLESAVFSAVGLLLSLLLFRSIIHWGGERLVASHWSYGLGATIWFALGLAQLRRLEIGGPLAKVRAILGSVFLLIGSILLGLAVTIFNPVLDLTRDPVLGPKVLNTLVPAYLVPAALLAIGTLWLGKLDRRIRIGLFGASIAMASLWLGLAIRHFWRGSQGMVLPEIGQSELYSYTVVLLTVGAALFYQSLARRNAVLRKAGLLVIGLAVAKVFMVDISGLGGLIRVFSLLFLGLALAGLAWLNRWAAERYQDDSDRQE